ncbi:MAG: thioredoxin-disulfide reductase [Candidatus Aminicenantaceae bacterium]
MKNLYDVIIVGAGPAGLSSAIYTGRARLKTLIIEKGAPGGQILLADFVENYPGFPKGVTPFQLMDGFKNHAEKFGAKIEISEAKKVQKENKKWKVITEKGEYTTRALIISTGSSYRKLNVPGELRLTGKGVSYCATCDAAFFKDKEVAVIGGGNHALIEALFLTKFSKRVKIIHRGKQFRGEKINQERIFSNDKIDIIWGSVVVEISGKDKLESITIENVKTHEVSNLKLDGCFVAIGMNPNSEFIKEVVDIDREGQIKVNHDMATSQPGIFAAGDITNNCPKQIAIAVGSGVIAALSIDKYLEK